MWKCSVCNEQHEDQFDTCLKCEKYNESADLNNQSNINNAEDNQRSAKVSLTIRTIIFGFIGVVTFFPFLLSAMIFDAPGSESNPINWVIFLSLFTFAPMCLLSIVFSWSYYSGGFYSLARKASLAPILNIIILVVGMAIHEVFEYFN
jgi:hypothetical protein